MSTLAAFEAAARHLSFTRAADELCVTPSAISHRIGQLEDHLDTALFHRLNTQVALTAQGERFVGTVREALGHLTGGLERLAAARHAGAD